MLENLDVYLSDSISKVITIRQNGSAVIAPRGIAYFHLEEQDGRLRLYIPKDRKRHHVCLIHTLPRMLLKHLGASSDGSGVELGAIITAPSLLDVDSLLEEAGIIELEGVERPNDGNSEELTPDQPQRRASSNVAPGYSFRSPLPGVEFRDNGSTTPASSIFSTPPVQQEWPGQYNQLLDFIIKTARELGSLPQRGETISVSTSPPLEFDVSSALYSPVQGEREFKTGAAGELFVSITHMT